MPPSIPIFGINLNAILEMLIVVQDHLLLMTSCCTSVLKYIRRLTYKNLQEKDSKLLAGVLETLNKAVHEALSTKSSEGASVALEATEKINIIDTVASNALVSAFGDSDCFEGCDIREKCNIIIEHLEDEHVRAYLANVSNTGPNESGDDSDSDFHRGEET